MKKCNLENINGHPLLNLAKANASRDLQINFNQEKDLWTISMKSNGYILCGFATQSGRSMIEMLGVLAIIGVLSVGGIAGYSKAMTKYRINKAIEQITIITGNVRTFFSSQSNYSGLYCNGFVCDQQRGCVGYELNSASSGQNGCPIVKKAKIFPDEMITLNSDGTKITSITNPFGYPIMIISTDKNTSGDIKAFKIKYPIVDNTEACIELLTKDWHDANIWAINVVNTLYTGKTFKTPVDVDKAIEVCSKNIDIESGYPYLELYSN